MEHLINISILDIDQIDTGHSNETTSATIFSPSEKLTETELIEEFIYKKLILMVCVFGIAGNLLNLIVLSQKSLTYLMERMEKSVHYGLIALAASDFFSCLTALPSAFYGTGKNAGGFAHAGFDFRLVFKLYGSGVINTFMLSSTWLTVMMAVSRYIAICHPLRARLIIGKTFTVASLVAVVLGSVLFNVPRFLHEEPGSVVDRAGRQIYFAYTGPLQRHPGARLAYLWTYFALGIVIPLCVLVFCNAHLIRTLRSSMFSHDDESTSFNHAVVHVASRRTARQRSEQAAHRITLTLVIIIVLFVVLFVPSELLHFFVDLATQTRQQTDVFNVAVTIGNLLQTINFAINFVLYSAVNTYFRYMICRLVSCNRCSNYATDSQAVHGRKRAAEVVGRDGEMIRLDFRAGRFADSDHPTSSAVRQPLSITGTASQRTLTPTTPSIAVAYV